MIDANHTVLQAGDLTADYMYYTTSIDDFKQLRTVRRYLPEVAAVNAVHQHIDDTVDRNTIAWPVVVRLYEQLDADPKWVYTVHQTLRPVLVKLNEINLPLGDQA